jgi:hypothetical protein
MHDLEMTPFETRLAGRLRTHSLIDVRSPNALALARQAMATGRRTGFAAAWRSLASPVRAAVVVALLGSVVIGALIVGAQLLREQQAVVLPTPSRLPTSVPVGPPGEDLRARWLAIVEELPALGTGSGPVTLTIDPTGSQLSLANLGPGASFLSRTALLASGDLQLELAAAAGNCAVGAMGVYRLQFSTDGARLTMTALSDACANRGLALGRTWERTLVGPTTIGAGLVDSFDPMFAIRLPDGHYEARVLDDWIEIGDPATGFSLMVFKNPQGFADSCSDGEVRYPYSPGAAAFVAYYRQNDAFTVVEATPLTIDGHDAIHLVTRVRVDGARCPGADLYALTPQACDCHFFGGDDSLYLVDLGPDTFLFQLSPTVDSATELPIIRTIRIPYSPGEASP